MNRSLDLFVRFSRSWGAWAVVLVFAISSAAPAQSSAAPGDLASRIDALVEPVSDRDLFSGVILVARGENILYRRAFGYANWELTAPNMPDTRFGIGSLTKAMTETVIELMVSEDRLDLESPVERYVDGFPRGPHGGKPTIGHLYTHRSGVPHRVTDAADETEALDAADIVERVKVHGLAFEPGAERLYSSAGFTCLARVIEIIEGKPFDTVLRERIFRLAGMRSAAGATDRRLMPRRASPYHLGADYTVSDHGAVVVVNAPYKNLRFLTGAGSVYATAEDLLVFLRAMHDGAFGPELWDQAVDADAATWRGWTGRTSGYEAYMDVLPAEDLSLILLSNLRSVANWQLRAGIRALLKGDTVPPIELPPPVASSFEPPHSLVGTYDNDGSPVVISLRDGHLFRGENEFYPINGDRYYIPASGSIMRFRRDESGVVDAILWMRGDEEIVVPRQTEATTP